MVVNAVGSLLLGLVGLPVAFLLNVASYLVAAGSLWKLPGLGRAGDSPKGLAPERLMPDLLDGLGYLARRPALLQPLLLTFATIAVTGPLISLLAAVVKVAGGSIVDLGLLMAAFSAGSLAGAVYAGARDDSGNPTRVYAVRGVVAALALTAFALVPIGLASALPLAVIGFVAFSEAVWNTSRVRRLAGDAYQARLQAITSMAFTLGMTVGALWAGFAVDRFGLVALLGGAIVLGPISAGVALALWKAPDELRGG